MEEFISNNIESIVIIGLWIASETLPFMKKIKSNGLLELLINVFSKKMTERRRLP